MSSQVHMANPSKINAAKVILSPLFPDDFNENQGAPVRIFILNDGESVNVGRASTRSNRPLPTPSNGLFLNPIISRNHAEIRFRNYNSAFIQDNDSYHGTEVNGINIVPRFPVIVNTGDVITFAPFIGPIEGQRRPLSFKISISQLSRLQKALDNIPQEICPEPVMEPENNERERENNITHDMALHLSEENAITSDTVKKLSSLDMIESDLPRAFSGDPYRELAPGTQRVIPISALLDNKSDPIHDTNTSGISTLRSIELDSASLFVEDSHCDNDQDSESLAEIDYSEEEDEEDDDEDEDEDESDEEDGEEYAEEVKSELYNREYIALPTNTLGSSGAVSNSQQSHVETMVYENDIVKHHNIEYEAIDNNNTGFITGQFDSENHVSEIDRLDFLHSQEAHDLNHDDFEAQNIPTRDDAAEPEPEPDWEGYELTVSDDISDVADVVGTYRYDTWLAASQNLPYDNLNVQQKESQEKSHLIESVPPALVNSDNKRRWCNISTGEDDNVPSTPLGDMSLSGVVVSDPADMRPRKRARLGKVVAPIAYGVIGGITASLAVLATMIYSAPDLL